MTRIFTMSAGDRLVFSAKSCAVDPLTTWSAGPSGGAVGAGATGAGAVRTCVGAAPGAVAGAVAAGAAAAGAGAGVGAETDVGAAGAATVGGTPSAASGLAC